jgi:hypothetical protein
MGVTELLESLGWSKPVALLSMCMIPRLNYLVRTHAPALTAVLCKRFDTRVDQTLRAALAQTFDSVHRLIMSLPRSDGGLGVPQTAVVATEAYTASTNPAAPTQRTAASFRVSESIEWLKTVHPTLFALVQCQSKKHASAWMMATDCYMPAHLARIALRLRAGMPVRPAMCGCGTAHTADALPHHVLGCARNKGYTVSSRHNAVRDAFANLARRCAVPVRTEPPQFATDDDERPDVTFFFSDEDPWTVDIHINTPTAPSHLGTADCTKKHAAAKDKKYKSTVEGEKHRWLTLGFETFGAWTPGVVELAKKLATVSNGAVSREEIVATIAVTLQVGNAQILTSTLARDRRTGRHNLV